MQPGFRDVFGCPGLRPGFWGEHRVLDRFGSRHRQGRLLDGRSGRWLRDGGCFGYDGGRRPGFGDVLRCPCFRFRFWRRRRLGRQVIDRYGSWHRHGRLLDGRSGRQLFDGRRFGYDGGRRPGSRDAFRCPRLRFGLWGGRWLRRPAVGRFGSGRRRGRRFVDGRHRWFFVGRRGGRLRNGIGGCFSGRRDGRGYLADPVRLLLRGHPAADAPPPSGGENVGWPGRFG
jgi:hypothetical protein